VDDVKPEAWEKIKWLPPIFPARAVRFYPALVRTRNTLSYTRTSDVSVARRHAEGLVRQSPEEVRKVLTTGLYSSPIAIIADRFACGTEVAHAAASWPSGVDHRLRRKSLRIDSPPHQSRLVKRRMVSQHGSYPQTLHKWTRSDNKIRWPARTVWHNEINRASYTSVPPRMELRPFCFRTSRAPTWK
jgi:hypothetical protein